MPRIQKKCKQCGKDFMAIKKPFYVQQFCCIECSRIHNRPNLNLKRPVDYIIGHDDEISD